MPDWKKTVEAHHQWAHPNDGFELVMLPPASDIEVRSLQSTFGFPVPSELRGFYEQIGGCGVKAGDHEVSWMVVPVTEVATNIAKARDWFANTHPKLAARFYPFIDWDCGDYTGYLQSPLGLKRGLYTFEHESYEFEAAQPAQSFLTKSYSSLEDLFSTK